MSQWMCSEAKCRRKDEYIAELESDKIGLLKLISDLQDEISDRDDVIESLENFCQSEIRKMPPDYVKHKQATVV